MTRQGAGAAEVERDKYKAALAAIALGTSINEQDDCNDPQWIAMEALGHPATTELWEMVDG